MKTTFLFLILLLGSPAQAQNGVKADKIDFLNLEGEFYTDGDGFHDQDNLKYGVYKDLSCGVYYTVLMGYHALVAGNEICSQHVKYNFGEVNYAFGNYYFELPDNFDIYVFLKENTIAGQLKDPASLTISGKKVKLYKKKERQGSKTKLSDRLRA